MSDRIDAVMIASDALGALRSLASSSVHAVITDPPFSSGTRREGAKGLRKSMKRATRDADWFGSDSLTVSGFAYLMRECALEWHRLLVRGGHALVFIDWRMMPHLAAAIESADLRHAGLIVWDKTYFGMGQTFRNQHELILHFTKGVGRGPFRKDQGNVISCAPIRDGLHATEKPVPLLRRLVTTVTKAGDTVLDCFAGSGSTAEAAYLEGRRSVIIERDGAILDRAGRRVQAIAEQETLSLGA